MNYYRFQINDDNLDFIVKENGNAGRLQTIQIPMLIVPSMIECIKAQIKFATETVKRAKNMGLMSCQHSTEKVFTNEIEVDCTTAYSDYEVNKCEYIFIAISRYISDDEIIVFSCTDHEAPEFIKDMQDVYDNWSNEQKEHPND